MEDIMDFREAMLSDAQLDHFSQWSRKDLHIEGLISHMPNLMMPLDSDIFKKMLSFTLNPKGLYPFWA